MAETSQIAADYYSAVIFSSTLSDRDVEGYREMGDRMEALAHAQPGCLGSESVRGSNGTRITVSYWKTLRDIQQWKQQAEHLVAQEKGKKAWYENYQVRIAKVEREYSFPKE